MHGGILKMIVTSGFRTAPECTKFVFGRGSAPDPTGGAYHAHAVASGGKSRLSPFVEEKAKPNANYYVGSCCQISLRLWLHVKQKYCTRCTNVLVFYFTSKLNHVCKRKKMFYPATKKLA